MRYGSKLLFCIIIFSMLSACNLFSPISPPAKNTYILNDPVMKTSALSKNKMTLFVSDISSPSWLDTTQMAYQSGTDQVNYFALNQWAAPPADLLHPIVVHALSAAGLYRAVVTAPFNGDYDQRLDIQLLEMQQVFTPATSAYRMIVRVQLSGKNPQKIIATKRFTLLVPSQQKNPQSGILAANQAVEQWLTQLVDFMKAAKK